MLSQLNFNFFYTIMIINNTNKELHIMFTEERHEHILNLLNNTGKVLVKDLSKEFNVSESMIRKDLQFLEKKNLLQRTYGGAINIKQSYSNVESFNKRVSKNIDLKEKLAIKAYNEITDKDTIFLDASTASYMIAKLIVKNNKDVICLKYHHLYLKTVKQTLFLLVVTTIHLLVEVLVLILLHKSNNIDVQKLLLDVQV